MFSSTYANETLNLGAENTTDHFERIRYRPVDYRKILANWPEELLYGLGAIILCLLKGSQTSL